MALDASIGEFTSADDYSHYCVRLLHFREPLEQLILAAYPNGLDRWRMNLIASLLRKDLKDLGVICPESMNIPQAWSFDSFELLGVCYVLEGSSLGARLLAKRAEGLGFNASSGARHLSAQIANKAAWPTFVSILERHGAKDRVAVARGAERAFALALKCFVKPS